MADKIRFGYVGCGFVAQTIHIPNFRSLPDVEFAALAEVRQDLGKSVAGRFGIPKLYKSHTDLAADKSIDAVGVSAAFTLQGKIAQDLLRAGKHVFMEKPMAVTVPSAEGMVKAAKESGKILMVGYMKRYDTGNILLKKHLDAWRKSGEMGKILLARNHGFGGNWTYANDPNVVMEWTKEAAPPAPADVPAWLPAERVNAYLGYLQQWTHNINLLRFFLADDNGVSKTTVKVVDLDTDGMTGIVVLDINGTRAVVESGYAKFHGWEEQTAIYFQGGFLKTQAPNLMHKQTPATVEIYRPAASDQPPALIQEFAAPSWSYREEAVAFIKCVQTGAKPKSDAADTLEDVKLYEEIYKAFLKVKGC